MDQIFAPEYLDAIFRFLPTNKDLHFCLLIPSPKVIRTYLAFIPGGTFRKLGYIGRIGFTIKRPLFNYQLFLKELSYDQFIDEAIENKCCKGIIIKLFRILAVRNVRFRRFVVYSCLDHHLSNELENIETLVLPHFSEFISKFRIALATLIRSQKHLKRFSLINSNEFASFPVQALANQEYSLSWLNSSVFLPFATAFSNLTYLEYSYGAYDIYDSTTPIRLLSDLIMTSCNTLKRIILDWNSPDDLDITQLVKIIAQYVINLESLKIPLYTLEQLAQIHRNHNQLRKLEVSVGRRINPLCALSLFANIPLKSPEYSIP
ncbi:20190_t:CDS:2, partial [Dentiscutata erythropus]